MGKDKIKVMNHFENISDTFDNIYAGGQVSLLHKIIDALLRKNILERRRKLILEFSGDVNDKAILDIGCGSGRYSVMLAKNRPNSVLGLDVSPSMINLARRLAVANNVAGICKFENCDFLEKDFDDKFDIVIAAGVFDYTPDPEIFLHKIKSILKGKALLSFPVKWNLLAPLRKIWLKKKGCPCYYYTKGMVMNAVKGCGLKVDSIYKIGSFLVAGNYIVVCRP
jgi:2-polyprenyl-3-methyl-5-hydroxy-6-metoxy-1,4-benzoquinol methylase